ncbi:MAG: tetratricopeptide repeat protein [Thermoanaerobaculia bacterium]
MRKSTIIHAGILLLVFAAAAEASSLDQGIALLRSGDPAAAEETLAPLAPAGTNSRLLFNLGLAQVRLGKFDQAIDSLEKAVKIHPTSDEYYWLGVAYGLKTMRANVVHKAFLAHHIHNNFERAIEMNPDHLDARFALMLYDVMAPGFMGGGVDRAVDQAREIQKRDPARGYDAWATILQHQKKYAQAKQKYQEAIERYPDDPRPHYWLAMFDANRNEYDAAFAELENAVRISPGYMPAWFGIGKVASRSGRNLERGEKALQKYLDYRPTYTEPDLATARWLLAEIYAHEGKEALARTESRRAAHSAPPLTKIAGNLGR